MGREGAYKKVPFQLRLQEWEWGYSRQRKWQITKLLSCKKVSGNTNEVYGDS